MKALLLQMIGIRNAVNAGIMSAGTGEGLTAMLIRDFFQEQKNYGKCNGDVCSLPCNNDSYYAVRILFHKKKIKWVN